jgi:hypothetical protein
MRRNGVGIIHGEMGSGQESGDLAVIVVDDERI